MVGFKYEKEEGKDPLNILNSGGQEGLFAHVADAEHASKAQAVVLLSLRKRAFNGFFAPLINPFANGRFRILRRID